MELVFRPASGGSNLAGQIASASWFAAASTGTLPPEIRVDINDVRYEIDPTISAGHIFDKPGRYELDGNFKAGSLGSWKTALGSFTVHLEGTLDIYEGNSYAFTGYVDGGVDYYNFDAKPEGARTPKAELSASVGRFLTRDANVPVAIVGKQLVVGGSFDTYEKQTLSQVVNSLVENAARPGRFFNLPQCFAAGTQIRLASGELEPIERIVPGMDVLAFDTNLNGRGPLVRKQVRRLFSNITQSWVVLSSGVTVTPGHHFLDAVGRFRTIEDILETDGLVVMENGTPQHVTGEYIRLVFDVNDDGVINARNEIDFTQWDPTAKTDMQALLSVFDTNDNGRLDSGDAQWSL